MGRVFAKELAALPETLAWSRSVAVDPLEAFVADAQGLPLVAVGSGGSATACHLAALLHRHRHRALAWHTTPLDVILSQPGIRRAAVLLASASGKNRDALAAFNACVEADTPVVATICLRSGSPLAAAAGRYPRARSFEASAPTGKDGYLATNSLLATCALLVRAYGFSLPNSTHAGSSDIGASGTFVDRHMVQVLFGGWGAPVATDLESKLNESALASAQTADYRNFGHGRHLWLAKRPDETVVVALITQEVQALAAATLKLFPASVPVIRLSTREAGPAGTLDLLVQAFHLVQQLGHERGTDPGRPRVPDFGRSLYHLPPPVADRPIAPAVRRKLAAAPCAVVGAEARVEAALVQFLDRLRATKIGAVALDFDGTLCTRDDRFNGLRSDVVRECSRFLAGGVWLGIATGRGKSVRERLQKDLRKPLWSRVVIGYYNASTIAPLADANQPERDAPLDPILQQSLGLLQADPLIALAASITARARQLTIEPKGPILTDSLVAHVMACLAPLDALGLRVASSTHSVDVLSPGIGKSALVKAMRDRLPQGTDVLCIGDRGAWPGNDFALLSEPLSLSVDAISSVDGRCWNLAPPGVCGPDATLMYLQALKVNKGTAKFRWAQGAVP